MLLVASACKSSLFLAFQAEQHFLKHNDAGSWIQDSALMLSMSKEVPWYLVSLSLSFSVSLSFLVCGKGTQIIGYVTWSGQMLLLEAVHETLELQIFYVQSLNLAYKIY